MGYRASAGTHPSASAPATGTATASGCPCRASCLASAGYGDPRTGLTSGGTCVGIPGTFAHCSGGYGAFDSDDSGPFA